ncbi:MAG: universal stress protein [Kofleriaceae bacterium]|nr:universal stress protein [Kofleriaceae bacterium]
MASSIVFGTTLKSDCQPLADVAALLAKRMNAPLRLVHVSEDPRAPIVLGTDEEHILGRLRAELGDEAERLRTTTGAEVHVHLAAGNVVDALVSVARFEMATALLVGGNSTGGRAFLGSTAERVARQSTVPALTLRAPDRLLSWLRGERSLRLLVGADLGRASEAARAFASTMGAVGPIDVEIVLVASPTDVHVRLGLAPPESEHHLSTEAEEALMRDLRRAAPANESTTKLRVLSARGSADAHLASLADQGDFDLVVVGQRRHSLLEQLWYGSVARGVLRSAPVSVVCVPPTAAAPGPLFREPRTVLVATDFTEVGDHAVAQALGAVAEQGTVHLAHVIPIAAPSEVEARQNREQAWYALSRVTSNDDTDRSGRVERHVLEGAPADQLLALADRIGADLIVLGARSHSVVTRALLGSVAQAVSERAKVPVLLVPVTAV